VSDIEALHMGHYLIENEGLFVGGSSALNLVAAVKHSRKYPGENIVTIIHDSGNRYLKKFYSESYLSEKKIKFSKKDHYDSDDLTFIS
jgi:cysteine synthase A